MRVVVNEDVAPLVPEDTTVVVTFTITDYGSPPRSMTSPFRWSTVVRWPNAITLRAFPGKSADLDDLFRMFELNFLTSGTRDSCHGKRSCTYVTDEFPEGGWYYTISSGGLVHRGGGDRAGPGHHDFDYHVNDATDAHDFDDPVFKLRQWPRGCFRGV